MISHLLRVMIAREDLVCWPMDDVGLVAAHGAEEGEVPTPAVASLLIQRADHLVSTRLDLDDPDRRMAGRPSRSGDVSEATAGRLDGGRVGGAWRRGGSSARSSVVAVAMLRTAFSKAASVVGEVVLTPLTLRTNCRAADSISSTVASGSSPRSVVMFRHMGSG